MSFPLGSPLLPTRFVQFSSSKFCEEIRRFSVFSQIVCWMYGSAGRPFQSNFLGTACCTYDAYQHFPFLQAVVREEDDGGVSRTVQLFPASPVSVTFILTLLKNNLAERQNTYLQQIKCKNSIVSTRKSCECAPQDVV